MSYKPILFKTEMVHQIDARVKTETRRIIKPYPKNGIEHKLCRLGQPGDTLWVKEVWSQCDKTFIYKSQLDKNITEKIIWKSSLFMPREAARLFLKIVDIKVERVQDITIKSIKAEGVETYTEWTLLWDSINGKPKPIKIDGEIIGYESSPCEDIQEIREHKGKPWKVNGNPWVWAIKFQKIN